jgi:hypothetical protein
VDIIKNLTLINDNPKKIEEKVTDQLTKTHKFELLFSNSIIKSSKIFNQFYITGSIDGSYLGERKNNNKRKEFEFELTDGLRESENNSIIITKEVIYSVKETVIIPPHQKAKVISYFHWIENLRIPFKAKITIVGKGPSFEANNVINSDLTEVLLKEYGFDEKLIKRTSKTLTFETNGILIGTFGFDPNFIVTSRRIPRIEEVPDDSRTRREKALFKKNYSRKKTKWTRKKSI